MCRPRSEAKLHLEELFPNLRREEWEIASDESGDYNCTAFASHDTNDWWDELGFWLADAPRAVTRTSVIKTFELQGYELCASPEKEEGVEKVAIYVDRRFGFKHVARQNAAGAWISKLGGLEDIEHRSLRGLEGAAYGEARIFMRRPCG